MRFNPYFNSRIYTASFLGVLMAAGSILAFPPQADAVTPGYNGQIALHMVNPDHDRADIYLVSADGTGLMNVTNNPASDNNPTWSPDGTKIAFQSDRDGDLNIYVINADGSGLVQLTYGTGRNTSPAWSPDGTKIAFQSDRDGNNEIYVMNADGSDQANLTNFPTDIDSDSAWSPDGNSILFRRGNGAGRLEREVYVMNADGTNQRNLTNNAVEDQNARFSPDGKSIVFRSGRDGNQEIYTMNADGTEQVRLTNNPARDEKPEYYPDGTRILFASDRDGGGIYVMSLDGSSVEAIVLGAGAGGAQMRSIANHAPQVASDVLVVQPNTAGTVDVLSNDIDEETLDGQYLTIHSSPLNGTASVVEGKVQYTPNSGFHGSDQLTYQICDSFLLDQKCSTGVLSITVQAPGAPAVTLTKVGEATFENGAANYSTSSRRPTFSGTASSGATIKVEIHSDPIFLTTTANDDGAWFVTPSADLPVGEHTVYITATLNGVTTELDSFVLAITDETDVTAQIPTTGTSSLPLRIGGLSLLAIGAALHLKSRRRARSTPPSLF